MSGLKQETSSWKAWDTEPTDGRARVGQHNRLRHLQLPVLGLTMVCKVLLVVQVHLVLLPMETRTHRNVMHSLEIQTSSALAHYLLVLLLALP